MVVTVRGEKDFARTTRIEGQAKLAAGGGELSWFEKMGPTREDARERARLDH
jgi:hypothetical protein